MGDRSARGKTALLGSARNLVCEDDRLDRVERRRFFRTHDILLVVRTDV